MKLPDPIHFYTEAKSIEVTVVDIFIIENQLLECKFLETDPKTYQNILIELYPDQVTEYLVKNKRNKFQTNLFKASEHYFLMLVLAALRENGNFVDSLIDSEKDEAKSNIHSQLLQDQFLKIFRNFLSSTVL